MKFARSLTRNMPKYLIVFFGLLLVFNVFAFFLTPGIKEGHEGKEKKKLKKKLIKMDEYSNAMQRKVKDNSFMVNYLGSMIRPKAGKNVKAEDGVLVLKGKNRP